MRSEKLIAVIERELIDLRRDIKAILLSVAMPILSMVLIFTASLLFYEEQRAVIVVVVEHEEEMPFAERLRAAIEERIRGYSIDAQVLLTNRTIRADVYVTIPRGLAENLSRIDGQARISVSRLPTSAVANAAYGATISAIQGESERIVRERIETLSSMAGISVSPQSLLSPLIYTTAYHLATGEEAETGTSAAMLLQFSIIFILYPPMGFVSDAIIGERERRTIERVLAAPIGREELLAGKILVGFLLGMLSLSVSAVFFVLLPLALGWLAVSGALIAIWLASAGGLIIFSAALAAAISSFSESARSSQILSAAAVTVIIVLYIFSLFVDISRISSLTILAAYLFPPIHSSLAIQHAAMGETLRALAHIAALYLVAIASIIIAARIFKSERLLLLKG